MPRRAAMCRGFPADGVKNKNPGPKKFVAVERGKVGSKTNYFTERSKRMMPKLLSEIRRKQLLPGGLMEPVAANHVFHSLYYKHVCTRSEGSNEKHPAAEMLTVEARLLHCTDMTCKVKAPIKMLLLKCLPCKPACSTLQTSHVKQRLP